VAADPPENELVYVAGFGFRLARDGFQPATPVAVEGPGGTATVLKLLGSADRTEVEMMVRSTTERPIRTVVRGPAVLSSMSAEGWAAEGRWRSVLTDDRRAWMSLTFPAVPRPVEEVVLRLAGDLGEWELRVPVHPLGEAARRLDVTAGGSDAHLGVTLRVTGAILDPDRTIVRIEAVPEEPIRFIRGIATDIGNRRPPARALTLVDDRGREYRELAEDAELPEDAGRSYIAKFPPADPAARSFRLDVPSVTVEERGDGVEVDVPVQPGVVDVGRYRLELLGSEPVTGDRARHYPLRVRFRWLDGDESHQPLIPGQVFVDGQGTGMSSPPANEVDHVDLQVREPPARRLRLAFPRVRLTAPWQLEFTRRAGARPPAG
jgi:hypothetical protein